MKASSTQDAEKEKEDFDLMEPASDFVTTTGQMCVSEDDVRAAALAFTNKANICTHAGICNLAEPIFRELLTLRMQCDALLNHCDKEGGECSECAGIICPHQDPFHFHHDGCPSCHSEASEADSVVLETDSAKGPCLQSQIPVVTPAASTQNKTASGLTEPQADHDTPKQKERYPSPLTPAQRILYDQAMDEIRPDLERICRELEDCTRLSAKDFQIVINAR